LIKAGIYIEQHSDNKGKAHLWIFSEKPFPKLSIKEGYGFEVKTNGLLCNIFPSVHESGNRYFPVGNSLQIFTSNDEPILNDKFINGIDKLCDGHYLNGKADKNYNPVQINKRKIPNGQRHDNLVSYANSLIARLRKTTNKETIQKYFETYNNEECEEPLGSKVGPQQKDELKELKQIFEDSWNNILKNNQQQSKQEQTYTPGSDGNGEVNQKPLSILEAKKLHNGHHKIIGIITSRSDIYVLEETSIENNSPITVNRNARSIQLGDNEKLENTERLDTILFDDMIDNVHYGELVEVEGDIKLEDKKNNKKSNKKYNILHATSIKYLNKKEVSITDDDIESFKKFACYKNPVERITSMFAPNVIGHDDIKRGILRAIVGGINRGKDSTGQVDTLIGGDPGTAKSQLGDEATEIKPNSRHVSAPHASTRTITAVPEKINEIPTVVLGAIPLSAGGICSIDEVNMFSMEEQGRLLDIMEKSGFPFDKMGLRCFIPAPTTIIATANPIGGKWNNPQVATKEELNLKLSFIDRFTQVYATRDNMEGEQIENFVSEMDMIMNERRPYNYNFLRKYLIYASSIKDVIFTKEARYLFKRFWAEGKAKGSLSVRMFKGLYKIAEAQAKLQLKTVVDAEIANQVIEDMRLIMVQYGQIIGEIVGPKAITIKTYQEVLKKTKTGMTIEAICEAGNKENDQVAAFIGWIWNIEDNHKLKDVIDSLYNHPCIKKIHVKPIILQWIDDSAAKADNSLSGLSGPSDDPTDKKTQVDTTKNEDITNIVEIEPKEENIFSGSTSDTSDTPDRNHEAKSLEIQQLIKLHGTPRRDGAGLTYEVHSGILNLQNNFITGQIRMRGESNGAYPTNYLTLIDTIFGAEPNTIEVCSRTVKGLNQGGNVFTVDINSEFKPDLVADAQDLSEIPANKSCRWRADPPYSEKAAQKMYDTELPDLGKLLAEGQRVIKPGSLMFLLCNQNRQSCPKNVKRIGFIEISVVPNQEKRTLNIYMKIEDDTGPEIRPEIRSEYAVGEKEQ
jgi:MoxR-like ATPase